MAKSDKDHAAQMLEMGSKDHRALSAMLDPEDFSEEVLAFTHSKRLKRDLKL